MIKLGSILYRWRGIIGFCAFWLVWSFSQPNWNRVWFSLPFAILGLSLRFWSAGYLDRESRKRELKAKSLANAGPYRFIRHPLYLGNFFLSLGVLVAFNLSLHFFIAIIALFGIYYALIIKAEEDFLAKEFKEQYFSYCKTTGAILPKHFFKTPLNEVNEKYNLRNAVSEFQTVVIMFLIYLVIYLRIEQR